MDASASVVVLITIKTAEKAAELAKVLVEERLAAGVTIVPQARSIYRWEGKVQDESEAIMLARTQAWAFDKLKARVVALHEYVCPEVIALPIVSGHANYLEWLASSVAG